MSTDRSNWAQATEGWPMRRVVRDELLIAVGRACGVAVAEALYLALASEPVDAHGARVDWVVIQARILIRA